MQLYVLVISKKNKKAWAAWLCGARAKMSAVHHNRGSGRVHVVAGEIDISQGERYEITKLNKITILMYFC